MTNGGIEKGLEEPGMSAPLRTIFDYHLTFSDHKGVTRYGVPECGDLISYYDSSGSFRLAVETAGRLEEPDPAQVDLLVEAIERRNTLPAESE